MRISRAIGRRAKTDPGGNEIPPAHKNARYAVSLQALENCDPELENPDGIVLRGVVYGGRDAKSYVPVQQSFDWDHGIIAYGASLETETTFATIGKEGVPEINLMSIQDFVAISLGKYVRNNLDFGKKVSNPPLVFGVNYFLRDAEGRFVNAVRDKHVWVKWMELRTHGEVGAIKGPTGWIPKYEDLVPLFEQVRGQQYTHDGLRQAVHHPDSGEPGQDGSRGGVSPQGIVRRAAGALRGAFGPARAALAGPEAVW